jgi:hypothetical protein
MHAVCWKSIKAASRADYRSAYMSIYNADKHLAQASRDRSEAMIGITR